MNKDKLRTYLIRIIVTAFLIGSYLWASTQDFIQRYVNI
jgi:hypothetical protein